MDEELKNLALEIDYAVEEANLDTLNALIVICSEKLQGAVGENKPILLFLKANCYGGLASIHSMEPGYIWSWRQDDKISEILNLRKAVSDSSFIQLERILQCKILTNIGCSLSQLGRFVEAIKLWDESLSVSIQLCYGTW